MGENNTLIQPTLGRFTDLVKVPYSFHDLNTLMAYARTAYYHNHGAPFIYPSIGTDPILLTSGAGAYDQTGAIVEIIPAGAFDFAFDLHWLVVVAISAVLYGYIQLFTGAVGAEVAFGAPEPVSRTDTFSAENAQALHVLQIPAGTRLSARFIDNTASARTCRIWVKGHAYASVLQHA